MKWIRALIWSGITLLFLSSLLLAGLQTRYAKEKLRSWLITAAKQEGMELSIEAIHGGLPLRLTFENVVFKPTNTDIIKIPELRFSIAFFPLLTGELSFKRIVIRDGNYAFSENMGFFIPHIDLPFAISVKELLITHAHIEDLQTAMSGVYTLHAKGYLKKHETAFLLDAQLYSPLYPQASLELYLFTSKAKDRFDASCKGTIPSMQLFSPLFIPSFEADLFVRADIGGKWNCRLCQGNLHVNLHKLVIPTIEPILQTTLVDLIFATSEEGEIVCDPFTIRSDILKANATAIFNNDFILKEGIVSLDLKTLSLFDTRLTGSLSLKSSYNPSSAYLEVHTDKMCFDHHCIETCKGRIEAHANDDIWEGDATLVLRQEELNLEGKALLHYSSSILDLQDLLLQGPDVLISGDCKIAFNPLAIDGGLYASLQNLHRFSSWVKEEHLDGALALSARLRSKSASQVNLMIKSLDCSDLLASELRADATLYDLCSDMHGSIALEGERIYFPDLSLQTVSLHVDSLQKDWKFQIHGEGLWKEMLSFSVAGILGNKNDTFELNLNEAKAHMLGREVSLDAPCTLSKSDTDFTLTPCAFTVGMGTFSAEGFLSKERSNIIVKTNHFPLELLSLSKPEFATMGTCSLDAEFHEEQCKTQGRLNLLLEQASILPSGKSEPLLAKGNLQLNLDQNILQIHTGLKATGAQFFEWTATLPVKGCLYPLTLALDGERPIASEIVIEGNLEEIFDFINIGSHKLSGLASCHLYLSKTLLSPSLVGKIELQEGTYENYITGTALQKISAIATAENTRISLTHFTANDESEGKVSATGEFLLHVEENFPFKMRAEFRNLNMLNYDSFSSNFTGPLEISGNSSRGAAEGTLIVSHADFQIPDELPPHIPVLPITYIHKPPHMKKNIVEPVTLFPISLDIQLSAKNQISVRGRGLTSEWEGDVHLGGTNENVAANGALRLLKGEFAFSGKVFSLTQGEITFAHKHAQEAFLSLVGTLSLSDATITAMLRGPLSAPVLTFQSVPYMPTSSILARILFNKDISEISPMQAIQLAQTIVTLSGGTGPDVLEKIRKSLGIDRLNIVSTSGSDEISVQIGKYITRGVMITLSQSADSSQVIVEVELSRGFIFQAETQEEDEGKFTLKWNRNY